MKKQNFAGVAVYPAHVPKNVRPLVGVWIAAPVSDEQRQRLMDLNASCAPGHIGVRSSTDGTVVSFAGKLPTTFTPRKMAIKLSNAVAEVTGLHSVLRQLRSYAQVSRALAPT